MEDFEEIDDSSSQARRWCFTINNPFGTDIEEIDMSNNTLPFKTDYYDSSFMDSLKQSDLFNFKYVKGKKKIDDDKFEEFVYERAFFKDSDSALQYFRSLENFRYVIFSVERGENEETEHIQGFIMFVCGRRFRTVRKELLFHHIEKAKGTNVQARGYCLKSDTHIAGPFEYGDFCEERSRTDIKSFYEMVESGATNQELKNMFPKLYEKNVNKIHKFRADAFEEKFRYSLRNVEVTYIYGSPGVGKSKMIYHNNDIRDIFSVDHYDNSMFTGYEFQDVILFDEFTDKLEPQMLNKLLDCYPVHLRGLGTADYASYHKVYIVSNYSPSEIYSSLKKSSENYKIYKSIQRRLHNIIKIDSAGHEIVERVTEWEDCTDERDIKLGLTKQIKCTYEFDSYGNKIYLYNRYNPGIVRLSPIAKADDFESIQQAFGDIEF